MRSCFCLHLSKTKVILTVNSAMIVSLESDCNKLDTSTVLNKLFSQVRSLKYDKEHKNHRESESIQGSEELGWTQNV